VILRICVVLIYIVVEIATKFIFCMFFPLKIVYFRRPEPGRRKTRLYSFR
jgi:hypothetical protein